jgi:hypothetical protein
VLIRSQLRMAITCSALILLALSMLDMIASVLSKRFELGSIALNLLLSAWAGLILWKVFTRRGR